MKNQGMENQGMDDDYPDKVPYAHYTSALGKIERLQELTDHQSAQIVDQALAAQREINAQRKSKKGVEE